MIIAAAQTVPVREDVITNLENHYKLIREASEYGVQLLVFPELSITGYERKLAPGVAFTPDDKRLNKLREMAEQHQMIIVAGAPVSIGGILFIGAFVIFPDGKSSLYTKQFLHDGEEQFFASSFDHDPVINLEGETIRLAICADIENKKHLEKAVGSGATLYLASIFYSPGGIEGAHQLLSRYAYAYHVAILMSNFGGDSWGSHSGGQSGFWNVEGEQVVKASASGEELVIAERVNGKWEGKVIQPHGKAI
ncbi:carbon-nitrogen hydrolase family protein [Fulvivirga sp. 29W222]|uniref:Carbon-nitrogen hydrolase family protein n=1 Tax=Fulvivirga marina TaxID=2494733 RepID=A0A937FTJ8_9BACT|nr:carbon-nitrogen hydrolase family protein [Fulvivirga marina]MBL6445630.1 carbon-nitrogen hydrolase family protein [Fulvivirga marina]